MEKQGSFSGTWNYGKKRLNVNVPIIIFEEDGSQIMYCPALDVSGYGANEAEAKESFNLSLSEFFLYTINKNTFIDEMKRMGWTIRKSKYKPMLPPSLSTLLGSNENFSRIFNNFPFRKIDESISLPC